VAGVALGVAAGVVVAGGDLPAVGAPRPARSESPPGERPAAPSSFGEAGRASSPVHPHDDVAERAAARTAAAHEALLGDPLGAVLEVDASPEGATVRVAGQSYCVAPCTLRGMAAERVHLVRIELGGYLPWSSLVDLRGRASDRISAFLRPEPTGPRWGWLLVQGPASADEPWAIYLNGRESGAVTGEGKLPVRPGPYQVQLARPGSRPPRPAEVTVDEGQTVEVTLRSR
jgi:hypothetical protein